MTTPYFSLNLKYVPPRVFGNAQLPILDLTKHRQTATNMTETGYYVVTTRRLLQVTTHAFPLNHHARRGASVISAGLASHNIPNSLMVASEGRCLATKGEVKVAGALLVVLMPILRAHRHAFS